MRFNVFFFIILFLMFSFFITINLFFERSFQKEAIEITHKELGLLNRNLSEKLSFFLNILPQRYASTKKYLKDKSFYMDEKLFKSLFIEDFERLTGLKLSYSISKLSKKVDVETFTEINFSKREVIYHLIFPKNGNFYDYQVFLNLDEIFQKNLKPIRISERGYAWLIAKDGTLIYHPTQPNMIGNNIFHYNPVCLKCHKSFEVEKLILKEYINSGYHFYYSPEKQDKVVYYTPFSFLDQQWILCLSIPYSELMAVINKSMKLHSLIVISIFLSIETFAKF